MAMPKTHSMKVRQEHSENSHWAVEYYIMLNMSWVERYHNFLNYHAYSTHLISFSEPPLNVLTSPSKYCIVRIPVNALGMHTVSHVSPLAAFIVEVHAISYKIGYVYQAGYNVFSKAGATAKLPNDIPGFLGDDGMYNVKKIKELPRRQLFRLENLCTNIYWRWYYLNIKYSY